MGKEPRFRSVEQGLTLWWPWVVGGALSLLLFWTDFTHSDGIRVDGKVVWGRDFVNLWAGGHFLRQEDAEAIYRLGDYRAFLAGLFGPIDPHNYSYPPVTFPIALLLSAFPYPLALALWLGGTGALFVLAARRWWPGRWGPPALLLLTPAGLMNIWAGHYGFLLGALFLLGWTLLDRRPAAAGAAFALMLIKPHLAALVPLALALRRRWTAIWAGAAATAALILLTVAAFGLAPWEQFLFGTSAVQGAMIDPGRSFFGLMSTSLATAILRISDQWSLALSAQALLACGTLALVAAAALRRVPTQDLAMLVATGTFLVLPYGFNYDMTVVCLAALRLWADPRATALERAFAILGFVSPQAGMFLAAFGLPALPLMLALLFAAQYRLIVRSTQGQAASGKPEDKLATGRLAL